MLKTSLVTQMEQRPCANQSPCRKLCSEATPLRDDRSGRDRCGRAGWASNEATGVLSPITDGTLPSNANSVR
jgi:hypothetical protein